MRIIEGLIGLILLCGVVILIVYAFRSGKK